MIFYKNFLHFWLDVIEKQNIIILAALEVKFMHLLFLVILWSSFLGKEKTHAFVHLIVFWLYTALHIEVVSRQISLTSISSGRISSRTAAFLLLIFDNTTLYSSCETRPSLMSLWLIIFVIGLSVTFGGFSKQILEMFFRHLYLFFLAGSF